MQSLMTKVRMGGNTENRWSSPRPSASVHTHTHTPNQPEVLDFADKDPEVCFLFMSAETCEKTADL